MFVKQPKFLPILGKHQKFSDALRQVKKQHSNVKNFLNWGPKIILHTLPRAQFFLKSHSTLQSWREQMQPYMISLYAEI